MCEENTPEVYEIRAFPNGEDHYDDFSKNGFVAIGWPKIGDVREKSDSDIKKILQEEYEVQNENTKGQILGFMRRIEKISVGSIILTPYLDEGEPVIVASEVTGGYSYNPKYISQHAAHQIKIEFKATISREILKKEFPEFNNTLNARLTLTQIDTNRHEKAIKYIQEEMKKDGHTFPAGTTVDKLNKAYNEDINFIVDSFNNTQDKTIKRSLLLAAFSTNESFLTKRINLILDSVLKNEDALRNIFEEEITPYLFNNETRNLIASQYLENAKLKKEYSEIRNTLAHNLGGVEFQKDKVIYNNKKGKKVDNIKIDKLLSTLREYANNLTPIINNDSEK